MHDSYSNRYDFNYNIDSYNLDDYETIKKGYWGYIRDKNADKSAPCSKLNKSNYDGFWGQFKDEMGFENSKNSNEYLSSNRKKRSTSSESENRQTITYKISQLKIQAKKREESPKSLFESYSP